MKQTSRQRKTAVKNSKYKRYFSVFKGDYPRSRWNHAHGNYSSVDGESFATFYSSPKFSAIAVDLGSGYSIAETDSAVSSLSEKDVLAVYAILQATGFNNNEIGHIVDEHIKTLGDYNVKK